MKRQAVSFDEAGARYFVEGNPRSEICRACAEREDILSVAYRTKGMFRLCAICGANLRGDSDGVDRVESDR